MRCGRQQMGDAQLVPATASELKLCSWVIGCGVPPLALKRKMRKVPESSLEPNTEEESGDQTRPSADRSHSSVSERVCVLRGAVRDATAAFLDVLDGYTLADLIMPRKALSSLLFDQRMVARAG